MKRLLLLVFIAVASLFVFAAESPKIENCELKGKKLYGRVKIVDAFEDFRVRVVDGFEDMQIKVVDREPNSCGEWKFVDGFEDLRIKFVDGFEDFRIRFKD